MTLHRDGRAGQDDSRGAGTLTRLSEAVRHHPRPSPAAAASGTGRACALTDVGHRVLPALILSGSPPAAGLSGRGSR